MAQWKKIPSSSGTFQDQFADSPPEEVNEYWKTLAKQGIARPFVKNLPIYYWKDLPEEWLTKLGKMYKEGYGIVVGTDPSSWVGGWYYSTTVPFSEGVCFYCIMSDEEYVAYENAIKAEKARKLKEANDQLHKRLSELDSR